MDKELLAKLEPFFVTAMTNKFACIDERPSDSASDGVKMVGATDGILDAYKLVTGAEEREARKVYEQSGLPISGHTDEAHGSRGCGYRKKVADDPAAVGAPGIVSAEDRFDWIINHEGAFLPTYRGDHKPVTAVINRRANTTLDQAAAYANGLGTFDLDAWYLPTIAEKLHVDPELFEAAMITLFTKTVHALAPDMSIIERT